VLLTEPAARFLIAHRGASTEYPENTLLAFAQGLAQGARALEFDVRVTSDGVPVVIHDADVRRTTDGSGPVADLTLADLAALDAGQGQHIPTLAEVLTGFPDTPLLIEIKTVEAAAPARDVLAAHGAAERVLLGAFDHAALAPFREDPWALAASRRDTARSWLAARWWVGTGGRRPVAYRAFSVPERYGVVHVADRRFVARAHSLGVPVHVWTVDAPEDARRLWAAGVSGIITNAPGRLGGPSG